MNCDMVHRFVNAYVDGELGPTEQLSMEEHVRECSRCEHLVHAFKQQQHYTMVALGRVTMPQHLRSKLKKQLDEISHDDGMFSWALAFEGPWFRRWMLPSLAAVGMMFLFFAKHSVDPMVQQASMLGFPAAQDVQRLHSHRLPMDVDRAEGLTSYFRDKVPVPVHPIVFKEGGLIFSGARFATVAQRPAATLYYDRGGQRVTILVSENYPSRLKQRGGCACMVGKSTIFGREGAQCRYWSTMVWCTPLLEILALAPC
ncbi:MAG: zf-HC2 domain-containing protein [Myxococcales bacterium]|nr:MAG: zf-HC2 domain-containing protein [Myxococcales bacterium]